MKIFHKILVLAVPGAHRSYPLISSKAFITNRNYVISKENGLLQMNLDTFPTWIKQILIG